MEQHAADLSESLTMEATDVAKLLSISRSSWLKLRAAGRTPRPIRLGRRVLWRVDEIREWVRQGCPAQSVWERL